MRSLREDGYFMPPEWVPHRRYWMAWPGPGGRWQAHLDEAREAAVDLAQVIAGHGPVTMLANPEQTAEISLALGPGLGTMIIPHSDWTMRGLGPTFLSHAEGRLAGIAWQIETESVARDVLDHLRIPAFSGPLPLRGGFIEVDGEGTGLATEALLEQSGRPRDEIERMLGDYLAVDKVIWLRAGLAGDTSGEVGNLARFLRPGLVVAQTEGDPGDVDAAILRENFRRLAAARDARNRALAIVPVPPPRRRGQPDGQPLLCSYANCFVDEDVIMVPAFEDGRDQGAYDGIVGALLDHTVMSFPALAFARGGAGLGSMVLSQPGTPP